MATAEEPARFSGFQERNNEAFYDKLVYKLIELLSDKCQNPDDSYLQDFAKKILKINRAMKQMEAVNDGASLMMSHAMHSLCEKLRSVVKAYQSGSTQQDQTRHDPDEVEVTLIQQTPYHPKQGSLFVEQPAKYNTDQQQSRGRSLPPP